MRRRAAAVAVGGGLATAVLLAAAVAWACTNLASLNVSSTSGNPGTTVDISGTAYATKGGSDVAVRWDSLNGPVLATAKPDAAGTIHTSITIPADATPGYHVLIATQDYTDAKGVTTAAYGTPARASFLVAAAPTAGPATEPGAITTATGDTSGGNAGLIVLTIALGVAGFALFAGGLAVVARQVRRRTVPARVPVE